MKVTTKIAILITDLGLRVKGLYEQIRFMPFALIA